MHKTETDVPPIQTCRHERRFVHTVRTRGPRRLVCTFPGLRTSFRNTMSAIGSCVLDAIQSRRSCGQDGRGLCRKGDQVIRSTNAMTTTHAVPSSSDTHRQPLPCAEASEPCVRNGSLPALDQALDCLYAHTTERDVRSALSNAEVAHNTRVIRSILEPPSTASDRAVDSLRICFTHGGDGDRRTTEWSPTRTGSAFGGDRDTWTWFQMDRWSADELAQTVSALGLLYNVTVTPSSVACPRRDAIGWRCSWMARVVDDMCARFVASLSAGAPGTDKRSCDAGSPYDMAKLAGHLLALLDDRLSRQLSCLADNASDVINGVPYRAHLIERARVAIEHGHVAQALSGPSAIDYEHMRGTRYLLCALAAFGQVSLSSVDTMGTGDGGGTTVRDTMEVDDDARPHCR